MTFTFPTSFDAVCLLTDWAGRDRPDLLVRARQAQERLHRHLPGARRRAEDFLRAVEGLARDLPVEMLPWLWDAAAQGLVLLGGDKCLWAAPRAYARARRAEAEHGLALDAEHHTAQALFLARAGALPAKEVRAFQEWITATLAPERAYPALAELVTARAAGGSAPAAGTYGLLARTAAAAGIGQEEVARALADLLAASRGTAVPPALFTKAAAVFAAAPPGVEHLAVFWELFPPGRWVRNDGGAWLHLLEASGAVEAVVRGEVTPRGGVAGWLQRFVRLYKYTGSSQGVMAQRMPARLYGVLPRLAPRLRAEDRPLDTWSSECGYSTLDAELLAACLAHGVPVQMPARGREFVFVEGPHLGRLFGHPVLGPRLERQVSRHHRDSRGELRSGARSAVALFPGVPEVVPVVGERVRRLVGEVGAAGLPGAAASLGVLEGVLDDAAIAALEGVEEEVAAVEAAGPLLRALRGGLPEELGWPAFDAAVAELGGPEGVLRVCSSWPVCTLVGRERAIAVDHAGRVGALELEPAEGGVPVVRRLGERFLVAYAGEDGGPGWAYWSDRPGERLEVGGAGDWRVADWAREYSVHSVSEWSGYRLAAVPPRWRDEGQLSDGTGVWLAGRRGRAIDWFALSGEGVAGEASLPAFFAEGPGEGWAWERESLSLVRLPEGVESPLGQAGGLSGFRVAAATERPGRYSDDYLVEGVDGRRARHHRARAMGRPWGVLRFPGSGVELLVTRGHGSVQLERACCYAVEDDTLQWEVVTVCGKRRRWSRGDLPFFPPVGFWHFLGLRDAGSSQALRRVGLEEARALVAAHRSGGAEKALAVLDERVPGVVHAEVRRGVARVVAGAAALAEGCAALVERVRAARAG
ncbi:hypothetical protein HNR12_000461 [Streptomonospora nanhaiensis]|uniref:Uncharacterized protein n=1 Tax=Streptomonospora nanhaiensis TaxID=1323731 RepID=A0A853BHI0_9ACTN|nr:hypothetical protein [Streptomonospora nanhaiensis]NYI94184.1 hypothetical protein [Streptomonospora nanhaiensis]